MSDRTFFLNFSTKIWFSMGDEQNFFRWLYSIPGYVSCSGSGWELRVIFNLDEINKISMQELVALYKRYRIDDMTALRVLEKSSDGKWFANPKMFWHKDVFPERA